MFWRSPWLDWQPLTRTSMVVWLRSSSHRRTFASTPTPHSCTSWVKSPPHARWRHVCLQPEPDPGSPVFHREVGVFLGATCNAERTVSWSTAGHDSSRQCSSGHTGSSGRTGSSYNHLFAGRNIIWLVVVLLLLSHATCSVSVSCNTGVKIRQKMFKSWFKIDLYRQMFL